AAAGNFTFDRSQFVFAAVQLDSRKHAGLAVFRDGDVLLGEIFEQVFAGVGAIARPADDANDVVQMVERDLIADQDVLALARFAQLENRAAANNFYAMHDEQLDQWNQAQFARLARYDGQ